MPKTRVKKAPKLDRVLLKSLLLEHIRPRLLKTADDHCRTYAYIEGQGYVFVAKPVDLTCFEITSLRVLNGNRHKYEIKAIYHPDYRPVTFKIGHDGSIYRW